MSNIIIDRRVNDKDKSSVNRKKFLDKVRGSLKDGVKKTIVDTNIGDISGGGKKVKIPLRGLDEPTFHSDSESGSKDIVVPGNDQYGYIPGDKVNRPKKGGGKGNQASRDGDGEDDFVFSLTREEFLDLFFENLELPNAIRKEFALLKEESYQRNGFTKDGSPCQLNVVRTMKQAKGRKYSLRSLKKKKLEELKQEALELIAQIEDVTKTSNDEEQLKVLRLRLQEVNREIEVFSRQAKAIPFIDEMDLRYNAWALVEQPAIQAVMFCLMDVSGSMDEQKKALAKSFFMILYLFLERNYDVVNIEFIRHHSEAERVDEKEFFYGTKSGGTVVSTAMELAYEVIEKEYPLNLWNVYFAQASDGDNVDDDNPEVKKWLDKLVPMSQYYAYVQISDDQNRDMWAHLRNAIGSSMGGLYGVFKDYSQKDNRVSTGLISTAKDVYPAFRKLFEKKTA